MTTSTSTSPSAIDFNLEQLRPLVGGTITGLARTGVDDYGDEFFGLIITLPNGTEYQLTIVRSR